MVEEGLLHFYCSLIENLENENVKVVVKWLAQKATLCSNDLFKLKIKIQIELNSTAV